MGFWTRIRRLFAPKSLAHIVCFECGREISKLNGVFHASTSYCVEKTTFCCVECWSLLPPEKKRYFKVRGYTGVSKVVVEETS